MHLDVRLRLIRDLHDELRTRVRHMLQNELVDAAVSETESESETSAAVQFNSKSPPYLSVLHSY